MTSGTPRVSVLIPVRDAGATLGACLRSLERQSLPDWECVLVDDGSRDDGVAVARRAAARDPRIRVLERPARGIVAALRDGLAACRAPLVARMDADDLMHRQRLERQLSALAEHPEWAGVGCHVRLFPRRDLGPGNRAYERWLCSIDSADRVRREAFIECPLAHPTLVLRRPLFQRYGYRDVAWAEDYDLVLRVLAGGHRLGVVPERLLAWRHGDAARRLSRSDPRYAPDRFSACKAAFLAEGFLREHTRYVLWGYGGTGRALRRELASHGRHPSHIVELHPRRLGQTIHGAPVIEPRALAALPREPLIASVAGAGPRAQVRGALAGLGFREERDFVVAA